jgi:CRISPR-associated protein Cmr4
MSVQKNKIHAYLVQCITNLHVGSGDANYGIIDKLVQRDTVSNYPTIHSSSLKGALRQHFEDNDYPDIDIDSIFGKKAAGDGETESGECNFLGADLVALPVRCSHRQFALTVCNNSVELVNSKARMLTGKDILHPQTPQNCLFTNDEIGNNCIYLEDQSLKKANYSNPLAVICEGFNAFDTHYACVSDDRFDTYTKDLPVIARNRLGKNSNLWYEEIVPHQTVFITCIISSNHKLMESLEKYLLVDIIQIGANSSVGYGLCRFYKIDTENNPEA